MYIKQLIKDEQSYWEFVFPFVDWADDNSRSLWHVEDLPKLQPFFDAQNKVSAEGRRNWSDEISASFDFYMECSLKYGDKNKEMRDAVSHFNSDQILEAFGYELPAYDEEDEEGYSIHKPLPLDAEFDTTFPFIVVGDISSGWSRGGDIDILSLHMVSLKDFGG